MRIAVTGGDGFLGRNAAALLEAEGHEVVRVSRRRGVDLANAVALRAAFAGCDAVLHTAGINREIGGQTYARVHREGTANSLAAAKDAGVRKFVFLSFLRARPSCGSAYHESKWDAEEQVRASGLPYTILRPGIVFGPGDHMLDHLARALRTFPFFALIGRGEVPMRPVAVGDVARVMAAACADPRMEGRTFAILGPEAFPLREAVRRAAQAFHLRARVVRFPVFVHRALAWLFELTMVSPLAARAQVTILSETLAEPLPDCETLPVDLQPRTLFDKAQILAAQPAPRKLSIADLRCVGTR